MLTRRCATPPRRAHRRSRGHGRYSPTTGRSRTCPYTPRTTPPARQRLQRRQARTVVSHHHRHVSGHRARRVLSTALATTGPTGIECGGQPRRVSQFHQRPGAHVTMPSPLQVIAADLGALPRCTSQGKPSDLGMCLCTNTSSQVRGFSFPTTTAPTDAYCKSG